MKPWTASATSPHYCASAPTAIRTNCSRLRDRHSLAKRLTTAKILAVREGESKRKTTHSCTNQSEGDNHDVEKHVCGAMCAFARHIGGGSKQSFWQCAMHQAGYSAEGGYPGPSRPRAFAQSVQMYLDQAAGSCRHPEQRRHR